LSDKIFFEGAVDNVPEYLQQADVFLLISNWEGLPISILEAMSYGLPVIASDVAGVKEEVLDGVNGFVVPRKDAQSITSAISALYYDRQMALAMGEQSRERFEKYFTIDLMIKRTIQLYKDLAGKSDR
jgi:glycosyltransferase involved in cell wall biosynthesis